MIAAPGPRLLPKNCNRGAPAHSRGLKRGTGSESRHPFSQSVAILSLRLLFSNPFELNQNPWSISRPSPVALHSQVCAADAPVQAMQDELRPFGIQVQTINPGPFLTGFNETMVEAAYRGLDDAVTLHPPAL